MAWYVDEVVGWRRCLTIVFAWWCIECVFALFVLVMFPCVSFAYRHWSSQASEESTSTNE